MKTILVTGANGQLGQEIQVLSTSSDFRFIFTDAATLNICEEDQVRAFFDEEPIDYCINCAAYTAVDKAETDEDLAFAVNAKAVELLARACEKHQAVLVHISTDYVYHNDQNKPFVETDACNPQGAYARTKLAGDEAALAACSQSLVVRTSWVYSSFGNNFVKTMLRLGADRSQLNIIFDQIGSPTYAADLADAILQIIQQIDNKALDNWQGIYHYSNEGVCSWFDFAYSIFELSNTNCQVFPIETKDYPTPAKRPHFSLLNKAKIKSTFQLNIPYWKESLQKCLELLNTNN